MVGKVNLFTRWEGVGNQNMREIKFRVYDKINGMVYEPNFGAGGKGSFNINTLFKVFNDEENAPKIMQFTGLRDKNGKEIYEGDIVKWEYMLQEYNSKKFLTSNSVITYSTNPNYFGDIACYPKPMRGINPEVIGNIYENPELLEETK